MVASVIVSIILTKCSFCSFFLVHKETEQAVLLRHKQIVPTIAASFHNLAKNIAITFYVYITIFSYITRTKKSCLDNLR